MRSHYCGEVIADLVDQEVMLCGWVHKRRDHGGVIFIDLRDIKGLVQIVFDPKFNVSIFNKAEHLRSEYVLFIKGKVRSRPEGMMNTNMETGEVEILVHELQILNRADPLPFPLNECHPVGENVRLKYRYLDLRRPEMLSRLKFRAELAKEIRHFLDERNFLEIETPFLTRSTPEGARDYLVPSRLHPGDFFALPQSPQLFKQLFMMSGIDRYYQIVKCFRDEDLRADRQPEFTQLDIEVSFLNEIEIQSSMEAMIQFLFNKLLNVTLPTFAKLTYSESMERYGTDKPDLRIPLEFTDVTDLLLDVDFKVFSNAANNSDSRVAALRLPGGCSLLTRKMIDDYAKFVMDFGAKGLAYIKVNSLSDGLNGLQSPILKFLSEDILKLILKRSSAKSGDIIFFGADKKKVVNEALGALRIKLGTDCNLFDAGWKPVWIIDYPMFEYHDGRWQPLHHPFTASQAGDIELLKSQPGKCLSRAYDLVLNGMEVGGGSIRIHNVEEQRAVLHVLGISNADAEEKFGFLLEAMRYGCPPHGGIAFGLDRIAMMMTNSTSIRDVIAFPKTQNANCLLTKAPSPVSESQLQDLHIRLKK